MSVNKLKRTMTIHNVTDKMVSWFTSSFTKVVVSVNSEDELLGVYERAQKAGIPCSLIEDLGRTEFNGVLTKTAVAVGPDTLQRVDEITSNLPLL